MDIPNVENRKKTFLSVFNRRGKCSIWTELSDTDKLINKVNRIGAKVVSPCSSIFISKRKAIGNKSKFSIKTSSKIGQMKKYSSNFGNIFQNSRITRDNHNLPINFDKKCNIFHGSRSRLAENKYKNMDLELSSRSPFSNKLKMNSISTPLPKNTVVVSKAKFVSQNAKSTPLLMNCGTSAREINSENLSKFDKKVYWSDYSSQHVHCIYEETKMDEQFPMSMPVVLSYETFQNGDDKNFSITIKHKIPKLAEKFHRGTKSSSPLNNRVAAQIPELLVMPSNNDTSCKDNLIMDDKDISISVIDDLDIYHERPIESCSSDCSKTNSIFRTYKEFYDGKVSVQNYSLPIIKNPDSYSLDSIQGAEFGYLSTQCISCNDNSESENKTDDLVNEQTRILSGLENCSIEGCSDMTYKNTDSLQVPTYNLKDDFAHVKQAKEAMIELTYNLFNSSIITQEMLPIIKSTYRNLIIIIRKLFLKYNIHLTIIHKSELERDMINAVEEFSKLIDEKIALHYWLTIYEKANLYRLRADYLRYIVEVFPRKSEYIQRCHFAYKNAQVFLIENRLQNNVEWMKLQMNYSAFLYCTGSTKAAEYISKRLAKSPAAKKCSRDLRKKLQWNIDLYKTGA